jgi:hypothetical protein
MSSVVGHLTVLLLALLVAATAALELRGAMESYRDVTLTGPIEVFPTVTSLDLSRVRISTGPLKMTFSDAFAVVNLLTVSFDAEPVILIDAQYGLALTLQAIVTVLRNCSITVRDGRPAAAALPFKTSVLFVIDSDVTFSRFGLRDSIIALGDAQKFIQLTNARLTNVTVLLENVSVTGSSVPNVGIVVSGCSMPNDNESDTAITLISRNVQWWNVNRSFNTQFMTISGTGLLPFSVNIANVTLFDYANATAAVVARPFQAASRKAGLSHAFILDFESVTMTGMSITSVFAVSHRAAFSFDNCEFGGTVALAMLRQESRVKRNINLYRVYVADDVSVYAPQLTGLRLQEARAPTGNLTVVATDGLQLESLSYSQFVNVVVNITANSPQPLSISVPVVYVYVDTTTVNSTLSVNLKDSTVDGSFSTNGNLLLRSITASILEINLRNVTALPGSSTSFINVAWCAENTSATVRLHDVRAQWVPTAPAATLISMNGCLRSSLIVCNVTGSSTDGDVWYHFDNLRFTGAPRTTSNFDMGIRQITFSSMNVTEETPSTRGPQSLVTAVNLACSSCDLDLPNGLRWLPPPVANLTARRAGLLFFRDTYLRRGRMSFSDPNTGRFAAATLSLVSFTMASDGTAALDVRGTDGMFLTSYSSRLVNSAVDISDVVHNVTNAAIYLDLQTIENTTITLRNVATSAVTSGTGIASVRFSTMSRSVLRIRNVSATYPYVSGGFIDVIEVRAANGSSLEFADLDLIRAGTSDPALRVQTTGDVDLQLSRVSVRSAIDGSLLFGLNSMRTGTGDIWLGLAVDISGVRFFNEQPLRISAVRGIRLSSVTALAMWLELLPGDGAVALTGDFARSTVLVNSSVDKFAFTQSVDLRAATRGGVVGATIAFRGSALALRATSLVAPSPSSQRRPGSTPTAATSLQFCETRRSTLSGSVRFRGSQSL